MVLCVGWLSPAEKNRLKRCNITVCCQWPIVLDISAWHFNVPYRKIPYTIMLGSLFSLRCAFTIALHFCCLKTALGNMFSSKYLVKNDPRILKATFLSKLFSSGVFISCSIISKFCNHWSPSQCSFSANKHAKKKLGIESKRKSNYLELFFFFYLCLVSRPSKEIYEVLKDW